MAYVGKAIDAAWLSFAHGSRRHRNDPAINATTRAVATDLTFTDSWSGAACSKLTRTTVDRTAHLLEPSRLMNILGDITAAVVMTIGFPSYTHRYHMTVEMESAGSGDHRPRRDADA